MTDAEKKKAAVVRATKWREANRERFNLTTNQSRIRNKEKHLQRCKAWREANKGAVCADANKRRAMRVNATPAWLTEWDWFVISQTYDIAAKRTSTLNDKYVVDHIVPLRGKNVCGLHTPTNLQVVHWSLNASKNNKWEDEQ